jgi:hypothetical protein
VKLMFHSKYTHPTKITLLRIFIPSNHKIRLFSKISFNFSRRVVSVAIQVLHTTGKIHFYHVRARVSCLRVSIATNLSGKCPKIINCDVISLPCHYICLIIMLLLCIENNQSNALNLIFLFIPYNGCYMFRQLYSIIREHLSTF